jgi:hypothetical protein
MFYFLVFILWRSISLLSHICLILCDLFLIYFNFGIGNRTSTCIWDFSFVAYLNKHYLFNGFLKSSTGSGKYNMPYLRNRKRVACVYGVIMHAGNVGRIREKHVKTRGVAECFTCFSSILPTFLECIIAQDKFFYFFYNIRRRYYIVIVNNFTQKIDNRNSPNMYSMTSHAC